MVALGKEYNKKNWVMQLHYGVKRDNNKAVFNKLGPDAGIDCINTLLLQVKGRFTKCTCDHG